MSTIQGACSRLAFVLSAGALVLLLGLAGSANAATYADLQGAGSGQAVTLSPSVTLTAGSVTESGGKLEISDATVTYGDVGVGQGVSGTASGDTLTLTGGAFDFDDKVVSGTFTIDSDEPLTFPLTGSGEPAGKLVPVTTKAPTALRAFSGISEGEAQEAALGVLPKTPQANGPAFYEITLGTGNGSVVVNLWQRERQPNNSVVTTGRVLVNVTLTNRRYRVEVINWQFRFKGSTTVLNAVVAGNDILNPFEFQGVSGSLTGEVELVKGLTFTGGSLKWDKSGFSLAGGVRVDCAEGSISAGLSGTIVDNDDWQFAVSGQTNNGCTVSKDLKLPTGSLIGEVKSVAGAPTGLLEVRGDIQTTLLPDGVNAWDAGFRFIYDGTNAGSRIEFIARAGIGVAQGRIAFDGTFALNADFTIPLGNSSVAFKGDIARTTPNGPVVYDVGGSADLAIDGANRLAGSVRLTNTQLQLSGSVTLRCPVSGTITGGVSADIPLTSSKTWALGISGGAGAQGCQVTKEFGLAAGSGLSGEVKSVNGVVSVAADAQATINTTLIPTKTSFTAGFKFAASQGAYNVAVNGSTQGAGFSAAVASNGTFDLSFNLDDLALGGVTLGAKGTIKRTTPGGAVAYSISGSLAGQAKIYDNLYLRGGSLSIDSQGGLKFSGTVRQICTKGYLDANASGTIVDSRNWAFDAKGIASQCTIGRAALFNGTLFYANIKSDNAKVLYNAGISATRINLFTTKLFLLGNTTTWLTNVTGSISNTCAGCNEGQRTRLSFAGTGNAEFRVLILIPTRVSVRVSGSVDIMGNSVRRVTLGIDRIGFTLFPISTQTALNQVEADTEKGFTT